MAVLAVERSDHQEDCYAVLRNDGRLFLADSAFTSVQELAALPDCISSDEQVKLYFFHPYICVTERFGLKGAVISLESGEIRKISREDYHADVSSYSIAFFKRRGKTFLVHQTQWNRLDIMDLETGENLTPREIICEKLTDACQDEAGNWIGAKYRETNHLDYFHSYLQVSPGGERLLSNGWHWGPADNIKCVSIDRFLKEFEPVFIGLDYANGYNWDRPCAFLDDDHLVIATDRDEDEEEPYRQLWFYDLREDGDRYYNPYKKVDADLFAFNEYGELSGELFCDREKQLLVVLSEKGGFLLDLDGKLIKSYPALAVKRKNPPEPSAPLSWRYSERFHEFYRYSGGKIETIAL